MHSRLIAKSVVIVAASTMLGTACSGDGSTSSAPAAGSTSAPASTGPSSGSDTLDVSGQDRAEVDADNFFFSPSALVGSASQTLTITVKNQGTAPHTFTIDGAGVDVEVLPGQEQDVTVTFPDSGSVGFYCRFHVGSGMKGQLTVG